MKKITCILLFAISLFSFSQVEQNSYTFDSSEDFFVGEGGTVTATPTGFVNFTHTSSLYARMAQLTNYVDADTNKFLHLRLKNESGDNDILALALGSGTIVANITLSTNDTNFKDYMVEITNENWTGQITPFKFYPKSTANGNKSVAGTVIFDHIIFSSSSTLALEYIERFKSKIYPNPAKNLLNIKTVNNNNNNVNKLELYDLVGKKVASNINSNNINIENLPKGMYIVRITTNTGVSSSKFLKN